MTNVRELKRADELKPGDWIAPRELLDAAAEVLHVLTYEKPDGTGSTVHLVVRKQGAVVPYTDFVHADMRFDLATEADLAELREQAERAQKIADIRALAAWLEANPGLPLSSVGMQVSPGLDGAFGGDVWNSGAEGLAELKRWAEIMGEPVVETSVERTEVRKNFGRVQYSAIAWHRDGRPAEPEPADPTGQLYSRDADDPTPVGGARVEPHVGGMTDGGLVDETAAEPVIHVVFPHHNTTQCGIPLGSFTEQDSSVTSWSDRSTCAFCAEKAPF